MGHTPVSVKTPDGEGLEFARALLERAAKGTGPTIAIVEFEVAEIYKGGIALGALQLQLLEAVEKLSLEHGKDFPAGTRIRIVALASASASPAADSERAWRSL